ncbi:GNAT family N-acetyltransferase [Candidatus Chlorohelix sp.]|uniref:GNAT family N-acetyltransferase n=1 Tax=Candidatus Chlorohelix sp. TaxID=3139201 RepID=UPI0030322E8E
MISQNPFDETLDEANLPWSYEDFTQAIDLSRDYDELKRSWARGHVSAINKASRAGLVLVEATTEEEWKEYFEIYTQSLERWETPLSRYDYRLFEMLYELHSTKIKLWLVKYNGQILSGSICFYQSQTVMYWHGAFRMEFQEFRAAPFMHAEIVRYSKNEGYRWYDFNPSGNLEGVITFKERFGTIKLRTNKLVNNGTFKKTLLSVKDTITHLSSNKKKKVEEELPVAPLGV